MSGVDVLAVLDAVQRRLDDSFGDHSFPEFERSRAAVAELAKCCDVTVKAFEELGRSNSVVDQLEAHRNCERALIEQKAALAMVTGESSPPIRDMQAEYQGANDGR